MASIRPPLLNDTCANSQWLYDFWRLYSTSDNETLKISAFGGDLSKALTQIGSSYNVLIIDQDITVSTDETVPSTLYLAFNIDCIISVDSGKTLTIYSPSNIIAQPNQQIFTGAGTFAFATGAGIARASWFPTLNAAISSGAHSVELAPNTTYSISTPAAITKSNATSTTGFELFGHGKSSIIELANGANCDIVTLQGFVSGVTNGIENITLRDFQIDGNDDNQSATSKGIVLKGYNQNIRMERLWITDVRDVGIDFEHATYQSNACVMDQVWIEGGCDTAGIYIRRGDGNRITNCVVQNLDTGSVGIIVGLGWGNLIDHNWTENNDGVNVLTNARNTIIEKNTFATWTNYATQTAGNRSKIGDNTYIFSTTVPNTCIVFATNNINTEIGDGLVYDTGGVVTSKLIRGTHYTLTNAVNSTLFSGQTTIYRNHYSDVGNTSGAGEDTLKSRSIVADSMGALGAISVKAAGSKSGAAGNKTIKLYFGATAFTVFGPANTATDWEFEALISNANNTASQRVYWKFTDGATVSQDWSTATIDTTADTVIAITGEVADGGDSITLKSLKIAWAQDIY